MEAIRDIRNLKPQSSKLTRAIRRKAAKKIEARARREQRRIDAEQWDLIRTLVWERDNHMCRVCDKGVSLKHHDYLRLAHTHHIVYRSAGGTDALSNLVTLCADCHDAEHRHVIDISGTAHHLKIAREQTIPDDRTRKA